MVLPPFMGEYTGSLSVYLPTSPVTRETDADRILFKNLVRDGVERLLRPSFDSSHFHYPLGRLR
jgi:hypothetical protein